MGQLEDMALFVRIVEAGSITRVADQMNMAKSAVSRRLSDLEKRLSTQLMRRTTRKSHLTDAGALYYQRALNILEEVNSLNEQTSGEVTSIEGTLKLSAPLSFGLMHLNGLINEYACQHEQLNFHLDFTDRHIDLIEEGIELAIRIGDLPDSTLQAKKITTIRHLLCASPSYLNVHGTPKSHEELIEHNFLMYGFSNVSHLQLTDQQDQTHEVELTARIKANNGDFLKDLAIKGRGIVYLPTFISYQALASGELVPLLTDYRLPVTHAYAVFPKNRFLSQRCRRLIDFIIERLGDMPYWDDCYVPSI